MKKVVKKVIVYSLLVGMAQFGLATATIEASPRGDRYEQHQRHNRGERQRQENYRHEREMHRRHNENARDWNDRQWRENQRHDNTMNEILAGVIGIVIGSQL